MEDILASIRRILNEEDAPAAPVEPQDDDVLVLDQSMMVSGSDTEASDLGAVAPETLPPEVMQPGPIQSEPPEPPAEAFAPASAMDPVPLPRQSDPFEFPVSSPDLMAPETAAAAASSVGSLVRSLAAGRTTHVYAGGPTLEDMVRAALRPLLKEWLDTYLPPMVERLVRTEIERVVGREVP
jgi:cell pole-organizing protein PopZ